MVLTRSVADAVLRECRRRAPLETGGVLVGYESDGRLFVTHATGPGPRAVHTRSRFRRDGEYTQAEVDRLHEASGGHDDYIGEWHSHPAPVGPSSVDLTSLRWISGNPRYERPEPAMLLARRTIWFRWRLEAYRLSHGSLLAMRVAIDDPD